MTYIECARKLLVRVSNHGSAASGSYAMWVFDWLFGRRKRPRDPSTGRRYEYLTGNVEEAIRVNRGEPFQEVGEDIQSRWTPGNEYLWDEYDAESLIDSDEKRQVTVNRLLYARVRLYRALQSRGRDIKGLDPFRYALQVPEAAQALAAMFPDTLDGGRLFQTMDVRQRQPPITGRDAARDQSILERVVREAVGDNFQVDPATLDMNGALSDICPNADGLGVMELGMDIMERLEIPVPAERWERFLDDEAGTKPIRLTPARLVRLFQEVGLGPGKKE